MAAITSLEMKTIRNYSIPSVLFTIPVSFCNELIEPFDGNTLILPTYIDRYRNDIGVWCVM